MGGGGEKGGGRSSVSRTDAETGLDFTHTPTAPIGERRIEGMMTDHLVAKPTEVSGLAREQFNLGQALLQPGFQKSRETVTQALAGRKLGRTSTFASAMTDIAGKEDMAESQLLSNLIQSERKEALTRSQLGVQMETAGLQSRTQRSRGMMSAQAAEMQESGKKQEGLGTFLGGVGERATKSFLPF